MTNRTNNTNFNELDNEGFRIYFSYRCSVFGAFLRYKITETPLLFNTLPLNVLIVNVIGAFILGAFVVLSHQWNIDSRYSLFCSSWFLWFAYNNVCICIDSSNLLENNQYGTLIINILANVGLSIGALIGGKSLMSALFNN